MSNYYCLIFFSLNKIYIIYGFLDHKNHLTGFDNLTKKSIFLSTKLLDPDFKLENFIDREFFKKGVNFLTNLNSSTNFYQIIRSSLPDYLRSVAKISAEDLESLQFKVLDLIAGGEIQFFEEVYKRRVFSLFEQDEISENLIPFLYFVKYAKLSNLNWIDYL